jgi:hypothetical protein
VQHYDKILAMLGEMRFGKNIEVNFLRRAALEARTATWNFGYQLIICCVTEEDHEIILDRVGLSQDLPDAL